MIQTGSILLAQEVSSDDARKIIIGCVALIALVMVFFVVTSWLRRRVTAADRTPAGGFTLGDLRELHRTGKMSNEEFEKAKALIVIAAKRNAERAAAETKGERPKAGL